MLSRRTSEHAGIIPLSLLVELYRSGALSRRTAADFERLSQLGIAVVCDFRRESERRAAPTTWQEARPPALLHLPNQYLATPARIDAFVARGGSREAAPTALGVDRVYLDSTFQTIDKGFGSFDDYRRKALDVSDADLAALKARLLE